MPEIEQKLVGLALGDSLTHDFVIPPTGTLLKDQSLVGQKIKITFKINKIRGSEHFSTEDIFAHFNVSSMTDLENKFESEMAAETHKHTKFLLKESLKQELLKHYFEIPVQMLQQKYVALRNQMLNDMGFKEGMDLEATIKQKMNLSVQDFEKRSVFVAEAMARISFLITHFAKTFNINVSNSELDDAIAAQKKMFPNGLQEAVRFFEENTEAKNNLRNTLLEDKVFNTISAKCTLVTKEHDLAAFYQITLMPEADEKKAENTETENTEAENTETENTEDENTETENIEAKGAREEKAKAKKTPKTNE